MRASWNWCQQIRLGYPKEPKELKPPGWQEKKPEIEAQCKGLTTWEAKMGASQKADLIHLRGVKKEIEEAREKGKERRKKNK